MTERWPGDRWLRPLVAVGFCGGFTTFSTFAVEIDQRVRHGHAGTAVGYLVASLLAGLGAALVGITLARGRVLPIPGGPDLPDPDLLAGDEPSIRPPGPGGAAMIILGLLVAGGCGALLRYEVELAVRRRLGPAFPCGTLLINVSGSFVLGLLVGLAEHRGVRPAVVTVLGTGLLGAYTTFSTFTFDTVGLTERGRAGAAAANLGASLVLGLGAAALGLAVGHAL